jgi:hypothetical protein
LFFQNPFGKRAFLRLICAKQVLNIKAHSSHLREMPGGNIEKLELLVSNPFGKDGLCLAHVNPFGNSGPQFKPLLTAQTLIYFAQGLVCRLSEQKFSKSFRI